MSIFEQTYNFTFPKAEPQPPKKEIIHMHKEIKQVYTMGSSCPINMYGDTTITYSDGTHDVFAPHQAADLNAKMAIYAPDEPIAKPKPKADNPKNHPLYLGD